MPTTSTPATALRYRDVAAAVDWLCTAFGFEVQTVLADEAGAPVFAQLTFGRALFMLAPVRDTPVDKLMRQPDEIGGAETQSCYIVVRDADDHYAHARDAGAEVVLDIDDDDFGGRGYTCRDPEGHIWTFGTYDPWQGTFPELTAPEVPEPAPAPGGRRFMMATLAVAVVTGVGAAAWFGGAMTQSGAMGPPPQAPVQKATPEKNAAFEAAERVVREVRAQLERERAARAASDRANEEAVKRAADEQQARQTAERAAIEAKAELERERTARAAQPPPAPAGPSPEILKRVEEATRAREAAERTAKEARVEVEKARADKTAAEMAKEFALGRAEEEQAGREAAERAAKEARDELDRQRSAKSGEAAANALAVKGAQEMKKALEQAQKRATAEQSAREAAEHAAAEAREHLAKEQSAKAAAWKAIAQLTKQLKQAQSAAAASTDASAADADDAPKKARPRPKPKKSPEADQ